MFLSVIRLPEVIARTGRCRSSIYADVASGQFPAPVKLGPRSVGWIASEVSAWLEGRLAERQQRTQFDTASPERIASAANATGRLK